MPGKGPSLPGFPCWLTKGSDRLSSLSGGPGSMTPSDMRVFGNKNLWFCWLCFWKVVSAQIMASCHSFCAQVTRT